MVAAVKCDAPGCTAPATHHVHVHCPFMDDPLGVDVACFPMVQPLCEFHANGHTPTSAASAETRLDLTLACQSAVGRLPDFVRAEVHVRYLDEQALALFRDFAARASGRSPGDTLN